MCGIPRRWNIYSIPCPSHSRSPHWITFPSSIQFPTLRYHVSHIYSQKGSLELSLCANAGACNFSFYLSQTPSRCVPSKTPRNQPQANDRYRAIKGRERIQQYIYIYMYICMYVCLAQTHRCSSRPAWSPSHPVQVDLG